MQVPATDTFLLLPFPFPQEGNVPLANGGAYGDKTKNRLKIMLPFLVTDSQCDAIIALYSLALHPQLRLKQYSVASTSITAELKNEQCDFVVSTVPVDNENLGSLVLTTQDIGDIGFFIEDRII